MKILVINGPNLNMLGIREPELYGNMNYQGLCNMLEEYAVEKGFDIDIYQSNCEGNIISKIQEAYFNKVDGIVINAGAYTHTSIGIMDALKSVNIKCVEVHITNIYEREEFRKLSYISMCASKSIVGHGVKGYIEAIDYLLTK